MGRKERRKERKEGGEMREGSKERRGGLGEEGQEGRRRGEGGKGKEGRKETCPFGSLLLARNRFLPVSLPVPVPLSRIDGREEVHPTDRRPREEEEEEM